MTMTKGERQELSALIRKREKVLKAQATERSAQLVAEFDAHLAKVYHWDDDPTWSEVKTRAEKAVAEAQDAIEKRCRELGIPAEFAPDLHIFWHGRGQNASRDRQTELRRAAKSRIGALEAEAASKIERLSLEAQTEIVRNGLQSKMAKAFLDAMPKLAEMMPSIQFGEIEALIETRKADRRIEWMN